MFVIKCSKVTSRVSKTVILKSQKKEKNLSITSYHMGCLSVWTLKSWQLALWQGGEYGFLIKATKFLMNSTYYDYCCHCRKRLFGGERGSVHRGTPGIPLPPFFTPKTKWARAVSSTITHSWERSSWETGTIAPRTETGASLPQHAGLTAKSLRPFEQFYCTVSSHLLHDKVPQII